MNVSPVQNHTAASAAVPFMYGEQPGLSAERTKAANDPAAVKKAAAQFEAIMLRQLLAPTLEPLMSGGMGGASAPGGGIYGYMLTDAIAGSLSQGGGLGLAAVLEKQLTPRPAPADITSSAALKPSTH